MPTTTATSILRGGEWLIQPSTADSVFTPERLTEEHRLIGRTAQDFVDNEVLPKLREFERNSPGVSVQRQTRHRRERWIRTLGPPATVARRVREATLATPAFSRWRRGSRPRAPRFTEDKALFAFSGNVQDLSGGSGSVGPK